jgi:hypothetical protein
MAQYCAAQSTIALQLTKINPRRRQSNVLPPPDRCLRFHSGWRVERLTTAADFGASPLELRRRQTQRRGHALMSTWPLIQFVENLEGFEFVIFLLSSVVGLAAVGFAIDYVFNRTGMGPFWNALYAAVGAYVGLCIHQFYFRSFAGYEPYLTCVLIFGGLLTAVMSMTVITQRWL